MDRWSPPKTVGEVVEVAHIRSDWERASVELGGLWNSVADGTAARCTSKNMMFFNSLQVVWAERYVMSRDGSWELARKMIAESRTYVRARACASTDTT